MYKSFWMVRQATIINQQTHITITINLKLSKEESDRHELIQLWVCLYIHIYPHSEQSLILFACCHKKNSLQKKLTKASRWEYLSLVNITFKFHHKK